MTENTTVTGGSEQTSSTDTGAAPDTTSASTSAPESGASVTTPVADALAAGGAAPPAYAPSYKFKYLGGDGTRAEKEFDEWMRPLVKDADTEKKLRELHERAYGLDFVKADRQSIKAKHDQVEQRFNELDSSLKAVGQFVQKGDLTTAFEMLGIPRQAILQHALEIVQYQQMTPEQRAQYDQRIQGNQQVFSVEQENQRLKNEMGLFSGRMRSMELDNTLSGADINPLVQQFDERYGTPGAFRSEVIRRGQFYASQPGGGIDIPVAQAVQEVLQLAGLQGAMQPQAAPQMSSPQAPQMPEKKPVIPNIPGRGTSPVKRVPTSVEDLRKLSKEMNA